MRLLTTDPRCHQRIELEVADPGLPGNPCDARELALDAKITGPDGLVRSVPGYWHVPCAIDPAADDPDGPDRVTPDGTPAFRLRWLATEPGTYRIRAWFTVAGERQSELRELIVEVRAATHSGSISIGSSGWAFQTADGAPWFPIGANICWPNMMRRFRGQKLADFRAMLERLAGNGGTAFRLWANAPWAWAIDWSGPEKDRTLRFGELNHAGCARLDTVVAMAEELGLRIMFCIDAANNWASGKLDGSPYALANGGPCATTADYFNLPAARAMTREKLRYVAARWGASHAIWCWELWNEVDGCGPDSTAAHQQAAWHEEMIAALRAADYDQGHHLITTSTGHPLNFSAMWRLPGVDFTQTHHYGFRDSVNHMAPVLSGYHDDAIRLYAKPHLGGELGTCFASNQDEFDQDGRTLHVALWSGALKAKACSPGLMWFWDGYIHHHDLYGGFRGIAAFLAGEPWHRVQTAPLDVRVVEDAARQYRVVTRKIPTTMSGRDFHRTAFDIPGEGHVPDAHLIPNTWYGWDRPESHITGSFSIAQMRDGELTLMAWGGGTMTNGIISGAGTLSGPEVEITVDGVSVLRRAVNITAVPGATDRYTDCITVPLRAGLRRVTVRNAGGGCFITGHLLLTNQSIAADRIWLQGLRWKDHARLWLCDLEHGWAAHAEPEELRNRSVQLSGLEPGTWEAAWWDTRAGSVTGTTRLMVDANGRGDLPVPPFRRDVAVKLHRVG